MSSVPLFNAVHCFIMTLLTIIFFARFVASLTRGVRSSVSIGSQGFSQNRKRGQM